MGGYRYLVALVVSGVAVVGSGQLMNASWPKAGVDLSNRHKCTKAGPSNPVLIQRFFGIGGTDEAIWDGFEFLSPQGPLMRIVTTNAADLFVNTSPGNVTPMTAMTATMRVYDTSGLTVAEGGFGDPTITPPVFTFKPMTVYGWAAYGKVYIYVLEPLDARFPGDAILLTLSAGTWRQVAPSVVSVNTIPQVSGETAKLVTGFLIATGDGRLRMRYLSDNYTELMAHAYRLVDPWGGTLSMNDVAYNSSPPAVTADGNTAYWAGHYGSVAAFDLTPANPPSRKWRLVFPESFDGVVTINNAGLPLVGSSINPTTGRTGNVLYQLPINGNMAQVKKVTLNGSIVGGPSYNTTNDTAYVVTLTDSGSTIYSINATTLAINAQRSDLGQMRTHPTIDNNGNIYIGTETGFLYSLDQNLATRPNFPIFVGAPIYTPVTIDDTGRLLVQTGSSLSIYRQSTRPDGSGSHGPFPEDGTD